MLKLKALLLTQGMHGMVSQAEGLAKALNLRFHHHTIKLKTFWNYIPPILTPVSENLLTDKIICDSKVIISCGRKSVIPSIALKRRLKEKVFTIHIQDPKVSTLNFDQVICPDHDGLEGPNVVKTIGAIHYLTSKEVDQTSNYLNIDKENKKIVSFIIGGPNNYYDYSEEKINKLFNQIKNLLSPDKFKLIVIPSYRTPQEIIKKASAVFGNDHLVIKKVDKNAYLSALNLGEVIIVTCDSISMISEAALTGKPIYVANMDPKRNNVRFEKFFSQFKKMKVIRDLENTIDLWSYNKLDEVNRIAPIIKQKMKSNGII